MYFVLFYMLKSQRYGTQHVFLHTYNIFRNNIYAIHYAGIITY